jgi:hypothetical protein
MLTNAVGADDSSAAPLEEVIRKIGQLHPSFATKAEGKTKMLLDDLTKDGYVLVWCPAEVMELDEEDVEFDEPKEAASDAPLGNALRCHRQLPG